MLGCSGSVPAGEVYGTYIASYPFGKETLKLQRDGSFVQSVVINGQTATARGLWKFDDKNSRVDLDGMMVVLDEFDHLRTDWQKKPPGLVSVDVERHWFRIVLGSAGRFPYVKQ